MTANDRRVIEAIHRDYAEDGWLTGTACKMAARDVAEFNEPLALHLVEAANDMDQPARLEDVMTTIDAWAAR